MRDEELICWNCRYFSRPECRRHAPIAETRQGFFGHSPRFPGVENSDWCGEFEGKADGQKYSSGLPRGTAP